ncbi:MAG: hypothetical protein ACRC5C_02345 [Bacilli bacterium]
MGIDSLRELTQLRNISFSETHIPHLDFLRGYKKLVNLEIEDGRMITLEPLSKTKNLREVKLAELSSDNELLHLENNKKLKILDYPIRDLSIVEKFPNLETIGIDARYRHDCSVLAQTQIRYVVISHPSTDEQVERLVSEIKKYCELVGYGYKSPGGW